MPCAAKLAITERCRPGTCRSKSGRVLQVNPWTSRMAPRGLAGRLAHTAMGCPSDCTVKRSGALAVAGPGVDRFTPDDTQLLSSVGRQIGVAIGNARLYAGTRERESMTRAC